MAEKIPTAARFFYFHVDNREEIKKIWEELAKKSGIKLKEKDAGDLITTSIQSHGLTTVATLDSEKARLSMSLYKNIVIISALFFTSGNPREVAEKISFKDLPGMNITIGGATLLIAEEGGVQEMAEELGAGYNKIETTIGALYQFEEKEGHKEHVYVLTPPTDPEELEHFLTLHFPPFDFAIHRLHIERDYFKNQRTWIMNEKVEIDKTVGDILHKRIVGESLNPENIEILEKEIDTLSSKYGILVNDGHLIRKARTVIDEDIEAVYDHLKEFGHSPPEEELKILTPSIELKKKLQADETSISYAIKNTKTAIDTVRTNVDLLRSRENVFLQEEAISFQVAAGFIEFIIVYYYSLASWSHLLGVERFESIPAPTRFISILLFTSFAVVFTHFVGKSYKENWKLNIGMVISGAAILAVFLYVVYLSLQTGMLPSA